MLFPVQLSRWGRIEPKTLLHIQERELSVFSESDSGTILGLEVTWFVVMVISVLLLLLVCIVAISICICRRGCYIGSGNGNVQQNASHSRKHPRICNNSSRLRSRYSPPFRLFYCFWPYMIGTTVHTIVTGMNNAFTCRLSCLTWKQSAR